VRFVGLFFASVARSETTLHWLPADLAAPTGVLLQAATVVGAIVFAAPVVTGDPEGALARTGMVVLAAFGLASTPLLASGVTGIAGLFMRRLRIGDFAEFGGRSGKVVGLGLLEVRLLERDGVEVRVPHLLSLFHPTRVFGRRPRLSVHVTVPALSRAEDMTPLLQAAALDVGERALVELLGFGPDHARYRVTVGTDAPDGMTRLAFAVRAKIAEATIEPAPREAA
jgi:small-conductance mechanosensitive channel